MHARRTIKTGCVECIQCDGNKRLCNEVYPTWQPILGAILGMLLFVTCFLCLNVRFRDDPGPESDAMDISYIETDEAELPV